MLTMLTLNIFKFAEACIFIYMTCTRVLRKYFSKARYEINYNGVILTKLIVCCSVQGLPLVSLHLDVFTQKSFWTGFSLQFPCRISKFQSFSALVSKVLMNRTF